MAEIPTDKATTALSRRTRVTEQTNMPEPSRASRLLMIAGLAVTVIGALDPLEGSLVIVPGIGLLALGAHLGRSRQRRLLVWSFLLVAFGVGAMWGFSAVGGFGGDTGRPMWWAIVLMPYPAGFVAALVGGIRGLARPR